MLAVLENQKQTSQIFEEPLPVAIFGFDQRTLQTLEIAFKNIGNNCATIATIDCARAVIFNFDDLESRAMFLTYRKQHPGFPIIVISTREIVLRGAYVLTKPLRVAKFTTIFQAIQNKLASNPPYSEIGNPSSSNCALPSEVTAQQNGLLCSQEPSLTTNPGIEGNGKLAVVRAQNTAPDNLAQSESDIYYKPETLLQSIIHTAYKEALKKNIMVEIDLKIKNDWGSITFFPGLNKVATDFSDQQLKYICGTPLFCIETNVIRYDEVKTNKMESARKLDSQLLSCETFLWKVALWTSNGRLPEGVNLHTPYRLRRWPNFTRLKKIPHSFSMAALFSQKPLNINLILKVSDISQEYIYSFFSCAYALDLLETTASHDTNGDLLQSAAQKNPKRGLFERIVNKLKDHVVHA